MGRQWGNNLVSLSPSKNRTEMSEAPRTPAWISSLALSYTVEILEAAGSPQSAAELSDQLGAPIATVYRRVDHLVEMGLLELDGNRLSSEGRREKTYRRTIDGFSIEFRPDCIAVEKEAFSEARAALAETWDTLRTAVDE